MTTDNDDATPRTEKSNMTEPQEEFIADEAVPSHPKQAEEKEDTSASEE